MGRILGKLPPLARPVQPRGKSPGRQKGARVAKATRYKVVFKATQKHDKKV